MTNLTDPLGGVRPRRWTPGRCSPAQAFHSTRSAHQGSRRGAMRPKQTGLSSTRPSAPPGARSNSSRAVGPDCRGGSGPRQSSPTMAHNQVTAQAGVCTASTMISLAKKASIHADLGRGSAVGDRSQDSGTSHQAQAAMPAQAAGLRTELGDQGNASPPTSDDQYAPARLESLFLDQTDR